MLPGAHSAFRSPMPLLRCAGRGAITTECRLDSHESRVVPNPISSPQPPTPTFYERKIQKPLTIKRGRVCAAALGARRSRRSRRTLAPRINHLSPGPASLSGPHAVSAGDKRAWVAHRPHTRDTTRAPQELTGWQLMALEHRTTRGARATLKGNTHTAQQRSPRGLVGLFHHRVPSYYLSTPRGNYLVS